jgi:hypothetical protein
MNNAHLRLAQVEYSATSKNWSTRVQVWCDRLATNEGNTLLLSLFGNDSEMATISAAIGTGSMLTAKLPDGSQHMLHMGDKATTYRGYLPIPGRQRPVRHMLAFSESLMLNGSAGTVTVLHNDDTLIWATVVSFLGLPAAPEWAGAGVQMLRDADKIKVIQGFNCSPVVVTATRDEVLAWIGTQVTSGLLSLPEADGPVFWPQYGIREMLSGFERQDDEGIAA